MDLTQDILKQKGITVDVDQFEHLMKTQKETSRKNKKTFHQATENSLWTSLHDTLGDTTFLGYTQTETEAHVLSISDEKHETLLSHLNEGQKGTVVLDKTPFYAEMGGQTGDQGTLTTESGIFTITDTQKRARNLFVHEGIVTKGTIYAQKTGHARINVQRRKEIARHHSAAHLLFAALRKVLGEHVYQKGSSVSENHIRFDFSHHEALTKDQLRHIETLVNEMIFNNTPTQTRIMTPQKAVEEGAMALFGEKYSDQARVISIGQKEKEGGITPFSLELCAGTHVKATGDIGLFTILHESSISADVRRIEASCGIEALNRMQKNQALLQGLSEHFSAPIDSIPQAIERQTQRLHETEQKNRALMKKLAHQTPPQEDTIGTITLLSFIFEELPAKELRSFAEEKRRKYPNAILFLLSTAENKVACLLSVPETLTKTHSAADMIKTILPTIGGKGGAGKATMAQAGGLDTTNVVGTISQLKENHRKTKHFLNKSLTISFSHITFPLRSLSGTKIF